MTASAIRANPQQRTVRQALTEWGWADLIPASNEFTLDQCYVGDGFPKPMTLGNADGSLQVNCGGTVLFCLPKANNRLRGNLYIVLDETEAHEWDAQARQGVPFAKRTPTSWRPHAKLRLVESA